MNDGDIVCSIVEEQCKLNSEESSSLTSFRKAEEVSCNLNFLISTN